MLPYEEDLIFEKMCDVVSFVAVKMFLVKAAYIKGLQGKHQEGMSLLHECWQKLIIETELLPGSLYQVLVAVKSDDYCRVVCEKLNFICR